MCLTGRQVPDPVGVALSVFGAMTVAGLTAAVEASSDDPSADAVRLSAAISELIFDGLTTGPVAVSTSPVTGRDQP